jgi:hypothetical protein
MSDDVQKGHENCKGVLDQTLHRFKNNLQTQLSLMNIQSSTNRAYFDDQKVIVDRIFALTNVYDLYYRSRKDESAESKPLVSLQSFMIQFAQYLKSSTTKFDYELSGVSDANVDLDDLLLLSYILIEINDFRKSLDDYLFVELSLKYKKVVLKFNFSSIEDHENFHDHFKNQYKILDLMVLQLKGKFEYKKKFVRLSFPIL